MGFFLLANGVDVPHRAFIYVLTPSLSHAEMGKCEVTDLQQVARAAMRGEEVAPPSTWYPLQDKGLDGAEHARGRVRLSVSFGSAVVDEAKERLAAAKAEAAKAAAEAEADRAAADAAEAANTEDDEHASQYEGKVPNELHITLIQAKGLLVMDKNLFSKGGSSDPFVSFQIADGPTAKPLKSSVIKKTVDPIWGDGSFDPDTSGEHFVLPVEGGPASAIAGGETCVVRVYDYDLVGASDFMGTYAADTRHKM